MLKKERKIIFAEIAFGNEERDIHRRYYYHYYFEIIIGVQLIEKIKHI